MFKKVKARTIIFALIIGIVVVGILGGFYLSMIKEIIQMSNGNVVDIINQADIIKKQTEISILVAIGVLIIFALIISKVLSKYVIYPKNKFIKSDEKTELKDKLSEVSTKKNQIETILLHMTDGIIAFNMSGEIILINPAAKKFLSISPEDNTFNDIFKKFEIDINMEKIIYLESWRFNKCF